MSLSIDPRLPELRAGDTVPVGQENAITERYWRAFFERIYAWVRELSEAIDNVTTNNAALRVPDVTIDAASNNFAASSGANAISLFTALLLPNSTTTTAATYQTALSYTGVGVLTKLVACSQVVGGASTAGGMSVQITVDGTVIYSVASLAAVSQLVAVIGSAMNPLNGTADRYEVHDDAVGIPFESSLLIEFKSGTAGQGVSIGWKVSKKH